MASTNKTELLGLNQWLGTDRPKMEDYNADNLIIDTFLKNFKPVPELTASRVAVSDADGKLTASDITAVELAYLSGLTSSIQEQLNGKQAAVIGAASTIVADNLTASKALASNVDGKVVASGVTATELAYLSGVTSLIQQQLNGKQASITGAASTITANNLAALKALVSDTNGKVAASSITLAELGCLFGIGGNIQDQLDDKQSAITGGASSITSVNLTASRALVSDASGKVAASGATAAELGYLSGVTSAIQNQLNGKLGTLAQAADSVKVGGKKVTVSASQPSSPATGDVWIQT